MNTDKKWRMATGKYFLGVMILLLLTVSWCLGADPDGETGVMPAVNWMQLLIPILVPVIIAGLKWMAPKLPPWTLPILAPLLGLVIDWCMRGNGIYGAVLGSAGVGLREVVDQMKKRMAGQAATVARMVFAGVAVALMFGLSGCVTPLRTGPGPIVTNTATASIIAAVERATVPTAVQIAIGVDTNAGPYLRVAAGLIRVMTLEGGYEPSKIRARLANISLKELRTVEAGAAIEAGLGIYESFWAQGLADQIAQSGYQVILTALADGIDEGLQRPPIVIRREE